VKESDLVRHLDSSKDAKKGKDGEPEKPLAVQDYQLSEALNVLKGLSILGHAKGG